MPLCYVLIGLAIYEAYVILRSEDKGSDYSPGGNWKACR